MEIGVFEGRKDEQLERESQDETEREKAVCFVFAGFVLQEIEEQRKRAREQKRREKKDAQAAFGWVVVFEV